MALILFWLKVFTSRLWDLFKISPIIIIFPLIVCGLLVATNTKLSFSINQTQMNTSICLIFFYSLANTLTKRSAINDLIKYKGRALSFRKIKYLFILKRTLLLSIPMLIFILLLKTNVITPDFHSTHKNLKTFNCWLLLIVMSYSNLLINKRLLSAFLFILQLITIYCILNANILLSFIAYCLHFVIIIFNFTNPQYHEHEKENTFLKPVRINPLFKATLHDYLTTSFLQPVLIILSIAAYIMFQHSFENNIHSPSARITSAVLTSLISLCFYMIIESIPKTNWLFYSIIRPSYKLQFKRIVLFMLCLFGIFIIFNYIVALSQDPSYLFKISLILTFNLIFAAGISLLICNMFAKAIMSLISLSIVIYLGINNHFMLALLVIPLFFILLKSINEHYGWYEL